MLILGEFLTNDIRATPEYKEYEKEFVMVDVPTIQPKPVKSTQGTIMTPTPTAKVVKKTCKGKDAAGESSTLRKSLKVTTKQKKLSTTPIPPPSDDRERDEIAEATLLSLTMHKTSLAGEAQDNVPKVQEKLLEEDIEKIVEGEDEESYASVFANSVFQDDDDTGTRLEPGSHKENPETVDDDDVDKDKKDDENDDNDDNNDNNDDDNDDHEDHALVRNKVSGSLETRNEKMHTPIPSPLRSFRTNLYSDKNISHELTATISPTPATTSKDRSKTKRISSKYTHILGALHMICRRQDIMIKQMEKKFVTNRDF
ncbi:hypothetical protein Tco_1068906 [Tanacetum coccineum]|uniref:Uncharacterized protein n=1 Tax=Tanacetum coccineum TaxID=301880 RepID=A0ABQ5HH76_9ASTR